MSVAKKRTKAATKDGAIDGRRRRRLRTEQSLVDAVDLILREKGVAELGVNAIAAKAGVEKVLVYRYYAGLDGLMEAYAARSDFWPSVDELLGGEGRPLLREKDVAALIAGTLANYAAALRKRPVTLDLLAWECAHRNPLTIALEKVREERTMELHRTLVAAGLPVTETLLATSNLLAAAINYLAARGREVRVFGGLGVRSDRDWTSIAQTIEVTMRALVSSASTTAKESGRASHQRRKPTGGS